MSLTFGICSTFQEAQIGCSNLTTKMKAKKIGFKNGPELYKLLQLYYLNDAASRHSRHQFGTTAWKISHYLSEIAASESLESLLSSISSPSWEMKITHQGPYMIAWPCRSR